MEKNISLQSLYKNAKTKYDKSYSINTIKYDLVPHSLNERLINEFKGTDSKTISYVFILKYFNTPNKMIIFKSKNITLRVIYKRSIDIAFIKESLKRCEIIIDLYNIKKHFEMYLIYSTMKKILPKKGILESKHINSAYTYINKDDIFIIRKEEHEKVMVHEILHHVKNIQNDKWTNKNIADLKKHFNISKNCYLIPNEAIIEMWAIIYNSIFVSLYKKTSVKKIIKEEIDHSIKNSKTILDLQATYKDGIWNEKSNLYCYIIFRTILLHNLNKLFKIYTFPYDTNVITKYIINNSEFLRKSGLKKNKNTDFTFGYNTKSSST
jgi:hypothetical protein